MPTYRKHLQSLIRWLIGNNVPSNNFQAAVTETSTEAARWPVCMRSRRGRCVSPGYNPRPATLSELAFVYCREKLFDDISRPERRITRYPDAPALRCNFFKLSVMLIKLFLECISGYCWTIDLLALGPSNYIAKQLTKIIIPLRRWRCWEETFSLTYREWKPSYRSSNLNLGCTRLREHTVELAKPLTKNFCLDGFPRGRNEGHQKIQNLKDPFLRLSKTWCFLFLLLLCPEGFQSWYWNTFKSFRLLVVEDYD